jgi:hypothetical protein
MGETRSEYKILVGKLEGKRAVGRRWRGWEDILEWIFGKWRGKV